MVVTAIMKLPSGVASRTFDRSALFWGLADQSVSSVTNLMLAVVAGRRLGSAGLGVVSVGFAAYVFALVLFRGLVPEAVVISAGIDPEDDQRSIRSGLTLTLLIGASVATVFATLGVTLGREFHGLGLFAPWTMSAFLQQYWRYILFAARRRVAATVNDAIWLLVMSLSLVLAWQLGTTSALVAAWGLGATAAAICGFLQTMIRPDRAGRSITWWRTKAATLGGWLAMETGFRALGTHGAVLLLALIVGPSAIGGLRAVQTLFTPLTLFAPAINLPGLPAMTANLRRSKHAASTLAVRLTLVACGLAGSYVGAFLIAPDRVLTLFYGHGFGVFAGIAWPLAVEQMALAAATGHTLALKASGRGRKLAVARAVGTVVSLAAAALLAMWGGVVWSAWGLASGVFLSTVMIVLGARRASPDPGSVPSDGTLRGDVGPN